MTDFLRAKNPTTAAGGIGGSAVVVGSLLGYRSPIQLIA